MPLPVANYCFSPHIIESVFTVQSFFFLSETCHFNPQANQSDYVICGVKLPNSEDFQGNLKRTCLWRTVFGHGGQMFCLYRKVYELQDM